jgi:hypothetical protein
MRTKLSAQVQIEKTIVNFQLSKRRSPRILLHTIVWIHDLSQQNTAQTFATAGNWFGKICNFNTGGLQPFFKLIQDKIQ